MVRSDREAEAGIAALLEVECIRGLPHSAPTEAFSARKGVYARLHELQYETEQEPAVGA